MLGPILDSSGFQLSFEPKKSRILYIQDHFLETREQELSLGTKINGILCYIVGDISF